MSTTLSGIGLNALKAFRASDFFIFFFLNKKQFEFYSRSQLPRMIVNVKQHQKWDNDDSVIGWDEHQWESVEH